MLEKWNGTWYGYITIREATGAYRLIAGKTYEVYVTVKLEESGAGWYVVYNPFGFPLNTTEILTQGACTADEESLTILEVAPFGVPIQNFDYWRLEAVEEGRPYSYTEPVTVGSDMIKGVIKLMRWGESWPMEDRAAFPDYAAYEAAVAAGTPPPYVP